MSGRDHKDYIRSVFEPLVRAATRPDLLDKLTTAAVIADRQDQQYEQFKTLALDRSDIVYLPNGGFAAIYRHSGGRFLAVSSAGRVFRGSRHQAFRPAWLRR